MRTLEREQSGTLELTAQQVQVVRLLAEGKNRKEIGADLGIVDRTVEYHLTEVRRKWGRPDANYVAVAVLAIRKGVVAVEIDKAKGKKGT